MDRLTAMQVFVEVAERSSLTDAANALEMSRAMVSRYLESLEHWLDARLLHRTTRRVSLTEAGAEALERCRQTLELAHEVKVAAGDRSTTLTGRLRITTSPSFAQAHLARAVSDFLAQHPGTQIELIALDRAVNLVEERIDLAVRIGNRLDAGNVARRLGSCRSVLCASKDYLSRRGTPKAPEDLRSHSHLAHAQVSRTEYRLTRGKQTFRVPINATLQTNETTVLAAAVLAGAGIAMLPTYLASPLVLRDELTVVLPRYEPEILGIHATYLSRRHQPRLLRAMLDFLVEGLGEDPMPWDRALASKLRRAAS